MTVAPSRVKKITARLELGGYLFLLFAFFEKRNNYYKNYDCKNCIGRYHK